jgi:hypothetical protein
MGIRRFSGMPSKSRLTSAAFGRNQITKDRGFHGWHGYVKKQEKGVTTKDAKDTK